MFEYGNAMECHQMIKHDKPIIGKLQYGRPLDLGGKFWKVPRVAAIVCTCGWKHILSWAADEWNELYREFMGVTFGWFGKPQCCWTVISFSDLPEALWAARGCASVTSVLSYVVIAAFWNATALDITWYHYVRRPICMSSFSLRSMPLGFAGMVLHHS